MISTLLSRQKGVKSSLYSCLCILKWPISSYNSLRHNSVATNSENRKMVFDSSGLRPVLFSLFSFSLI